MLNPSTRINFRSLKIALLFHFNGELAFFQATGGGSILFRWR